MGIAASVLMGKGSPQTQMVNMITGTLYNSFVEKETKTFPQFHVALLDIFSTFNSALPGKHYDVPSRQEVESCFEKFIKEKDDAKRKEVFVEFIKAKVGFNKPESMTLIAGLVTPPAAMAAKKAGERVPALKMIKVVPDVIFVPSITFLALITAKVSRTVYRKRIVQRDQLKAEEQQNGEEQKAKEEQKA